MKKKQEERKKNKVILLFKRMKMKTCQPTVDFSKKIFFLGGEREKIVHDANTHQLN